MNIGAGYVVGLYCSLAGVGYSTGAVTMGTGTGNSIIMLFLIFILI